LNFAGWSNQCKHSDLALEVDGDGKSWRIGTEVYGDRDILRRDVIGRKLSVPNAERIFFIRHALRAGFTIEEIFGLTKIGRWFHHPFTTTPSELFSFCRFTQRSRFAPTLG